MGLAFINNFVSAIPKKWYIVLVILLILIILDKALTYYNLKAIQKNFPNANPLDAERNPLAKWLFSKCGLFWGNFIMVFVSIVSGLLFIFLAWFLLQFYWYENALTLALWILFIIYGFTIGNNLLFLLKYTKVIN